MTPHQTTFLKVIDAYVRHRKSYTTSGDHHSFLAKAFLELSSYSQRAIRRSLGLESAVDVGSSVQEATPDELKELDLRLPKASAALILLSQSLTTICLQYQSAQGVYTGYRAAVVATQADGFLENLVGKDTGNDFFCCS